MKLNRQYSQGSSTLLYLGVSVFLALVQVIVLPFVTDLLNAKEYGEYALATTIFGVIVVAAQFGMPNAFVVYFFRKENKNNALLPEITGIYIYSVIIIWILSIVTMMSGLAQVLELPLSMLFWVLVACSLEVFFELMRINLRLEKKALAYALLMVSRFVLFNALFVLLLFFDFGSGELKFMSMSLITILGIFVYLFSTKIEIPIIRITSLKKQLFSFVLPIYPGLLLKVFLVSIDHFIVLLFLDYEALAVYALAVQLTWPINRFSASVLDAFAPNIYEKLSSNYSKKPEYYHEQLTYFLIALITICLPLIVLPEFYINLLVSNESLSNVISIFLIVVIGRFFESLAPFFEIYYYHNHKTITIGLLSVSFLGILILSQFLLIPKFGLFGAVYAYTLARISYLVLLNLFMDRSFINYSLKSILLLFVFLTSSLVSYLTIEPIIKISSISLLLAFALVIFKKDLLMLLQRFKEFKTKLTK